VREVERIFDAAGCRGALHIVRLSNGQEVSLRPDEPWVMASIVKVAIALEFHAATVDGRVDPATPVRVTDSNRTPGPVGISRFSDPVTLSLRDLTYLMLTVSDNAATDIVTAASGGVEAINLRLARAGCSSTRVVSDLATMLDYTAHDLGYETYRDLLVAQRGDRGPEEQATATDSGRIDSCRALDPASASATTARDMTTLLAGIWADTAAPPSACAAVRDTMSEQVTRRLASAVPERGRLAAKSGGLFGRVRNEVAVISDPDGECFALCVLTRAHRAFERQAAIDTAMADACGVGLETLRQSL